MTHLFPNQIKLALESIIGKPIGSGNHELLNHWLGLTRCRSDIRFFCFCRNSPPTEQLLPLLENNCLEQLFAGRAFGFRLWEKDIPGSKLPGWW